MHNAQCIMHNWADAFVNAQFDVTDIKQSQQSQTRKTRKKLFSLFLFVDFV